jgi:hypothetical protein
MSIYILGLGGAGGRLADKLLTYQPYKVYTIDSAAKKNANHYQVVPQIKPEAYEHQCPRDIKEKLGINLLSEDEVWLFLAGGGTISGMSLVLLEQFKSCKLNVFYLRPNRRALAGASFQQERTTFNVFQEYARSGIFERLILIDNAAVDLILEDVSISEYHKKANEAIVSLFHMINVFQRNESVLGVLSQRTDHARIETLGIVNLKREQEQLLYPLRHIAEKEYYCGINKRRLAEDLELKKKIQMILDKNISDNKFSYGVYETEYDQDIVYCLARTSQIQPENFA